VPSTTAISAAATAAAFAAAAAIAAVTVSATRCGGALPAARLRRGSSFRSHRRDAPRRHGPPKGRPTGLQVPPTPRRPCGPPRRRRRRRRRQRTAVGAVATGASRSLAAPTRRGDTAATPTTPHLPTPHWPTLVANRRLFCGTADGAHQPPHPRRSAPVVGGSGGGGLHVWWWRDGCPHGVGTATTATQWCLLCVHEPTHFS